MHAPIHPHRGGALLAFGILSLIPPFMALPFGLSAWVMAKNDLRDMGAGRMDRSGQQMTKAAQACAALGASIWLACAISLLLLLVTR